jgi:hypothetical protein
MMIDTLAKQLIFSTVRITNVATVDESMGAVGNMSQSYAEFVETADPDQLLAWQRLRPAVDTIGAVVELVARSFGARSLLFPMIKSPVGNVIAPEDFAAIDDAAIFTSTPGTLGSTMASYRDYADIVATQGSIKPRDPGMRFSQWLGTRTLNSVSQAREVVRCWAEAKVEASITPGLVGRLHNPYALSSKARATLPGRG